jgi:hypothetical protein
MEAIRRAVAQGNWDRLGAAPWVVVHLGVEADTGDVRMRWYILGDQGDTADLFTMSYIRMLASKSATGAFLFEASLAQYAARNGKYDAVVGLVGGKDGRDGSGSSSSRVRVRILGEEEGEDELVVAAGELRPVWRRVTLLPAINRRFRDLRRTPATFELLSGPPPRVLVASLCEQDRRAAAHARILRLPDGAPPLAWADGTGTGHDSRHGPEDLELPDLVEAAVRPEAAVRRRCAAVTKELMEAVWHPRRVAHLGGVEALDAV